MPMLQGGTSVPHFDTKAEANQRFASGVPITYLRAPRSSGTTSYMFGMAPETGTTRPSTGRSRWATDKLAGRSPPRTSARRPTGIFKAGDSQIGKTVGIYGEALTISEMGEKLSKGLGMPPIYYHAAEADEYRGYGFPGADEMGMYCPGLSRLRRRRCSARAARRPPGRSTRRCRTSISSSPRTSGIEAAAEPGPRSGDNHLAGSR